MAQYESSKVVSFTAASAVAASGLFVEANSAGDFNCSTANADTDRPVGVSVEAAASTGDAVGVAISGIVVVTSGAAVAIGDQVAPDAAGKARPAASGDSMCGTALQAAAGADESISILLGYQGQVVE